MPVMSARFAMAIDDPSYMTVEQQRELTSEQGWIATMALTRDLPLEDPAREAPRTDALIVLGLMFGLLSLAGLGTLVGSLLLFGAHGPVWIELADLPDLHLR